MRNLKIFFLILLTIGISSCSNKRKDTNEIIGSWKLIFNQIKEGDSIHVKDLSNIDFIKVINNTHFSFINQPKDSFSNFYAGTGTYTFDGENYIETLKYIEYKAIRNHQFSFKVKRIGDTLIQYGREKVEAANLDRDIIEKYLLIK